MMNTSVPIWKRLLASLASLKLTVVGLLILTVLTIWGTLYQADHGLFRAQERFYQSWVFLAGGWFPFPGAQLVMLVLFINLAAALFYLAIIRRLNWGIFLTHVGLVLMLGAGGVTFYYGSESHLSLMEQEASNVTLSYNAWELSAWKDTGNMDDIEVTAIDVRSLRPGQALSFVPLSLELSIVERLDNCVPEEDAGGSTKTLLNASGIQGLKKARLSREPQNDRPGVVFRVQRDGEEAVDILLYAGDNRPTRLEQPGATYAFQLRRKRVPIPALVRLLDFQKELHPGSQVAKSYSSRVAVEDGDLRREVLVSMNKPLRYKGFTFYQSSYREFPDGREASTLSVVRNIGHTLPYVATGVTVVGMVIHFMGLLVLRLRRTPPGKGVAA